MRLIGDLHHGDRFEGNWNGHFPKNNTTIATTWWVILRYLTLSPSQYRIAPIKRAMCFG